MQAQVVSGSSKHTVTAANGISYELDSIVTSYSVRTSDFKAAVDGNAIDSAPSRLYTGMADDGASIFLSRKDDGGPEYVRILGADGDKTMQVTPWKAWTISWS